MGTGFRIPHSRSAMKENGFGHSHYDPHELRMYDYGEGDKKRSTKGFLSLQRFIVKFYMLPERVQIIIMMCSGLVGVILLVLAWQEGDSSNSAIYKNKIMRSIQTRDEYFPDLFADPQRPSKEKHYTENVYHRPNLPHKPRILQLEYKELPPLPRPQGDTDTEHVGESYDEPRLAMVGATSLRTGELPEAGKRELNPRYNPLSKEVKKLRGIEELEKDGCKRMADWQEGHNPNCNNIHEASWGFTHPLSDRANEVHTESSVDTDLDIDHPLEQMRLVAGGAFRWVWMIREPITNKRYALKTLRVDSKSKNFDMRNFDRHRRDAVAFEQLSSSPLIVDIYGYCSNTAIFDWSAEGDLTNIFVDRPEITKEELLPIAYNVSMSIHDAHHFDEQGRPTIAHTDIKPDQFLYQHGYYQLSDFNRLRFLTWDDNKKKVCGFRISKNGGQWRSPEEYNYEPETNNVDVYSLGNVLYFLLTRHEPWDEISDHEVYEEVKAKRRPPIPPEIRESSHPFDKYMIEAIQMAFVHDQYTRPGAFEIAQKLKEGIDEMNRRPGLR